MTSFLVRVSVVVPCFNYGHHLAEAVESILAQSLRDIEVIVVDDGSTDDTRSVAQALIAAHPDRAVTLISQENSGSPGAARNAGIAEARADYVVCLDADDKLHPDYLSACVAALDANQAAAIAYGDFQMFGGAQDLVQPPQWNTRAQLDRNLVPTASLFRRQAWEQVGGYDPCIGYEDWDFWIGCVERGWLGVKATGALWHYRVHNGGVYSRHIREDQGIKAEIVLKHPSLYSAGQRRWASGVLAEDPAALQSETPVGVMPPFLPEPHPPAPAGGRALPIRSVCLVTKDYPPNTPGGIPRAVHMQARMLAAAGVEVHVITSSHSGGERLREEDGVLIHEIPEPGIAMPPELYYLEVPVWSYAVAAKFRQLDASVVFDVVETPDYRAEALHIVTRPETPLIVWLHSTMMVAWECEPAYVRTPGDDAWHALEMAALERADLLLAPTELLRATTARYLGERMRPVELMPYLFDSEQFPVLRRERSDGKIRALFYGRLEARKNPELALRAVAAARASGMDVDLTLLGRNNAGYQERVLLPLQHELGLHDINYLPHADVATLREVLANTDVAILPSRFDNSPLTIFESLSSGVPVITSDRVGTCSWIDPEDGLLALPIEDPASFATAAAAAMADPLWMATGERAAARIREKFSPAIVTEQLLGCYARLMAARGAGDSKSRTAPTPEFHSTYRERIDGARGNAVLAFADEIVADPSLLSCWAQTFDARDDVTLVIHAPGWSAEEAEQKLVPAVARAGLDRDDAADLLALVLPESHATEARLARGASGVLSRRVSEAPFHNLLTVDEISIAALREVLVTD